MNTDIDGHIHTDRYIVDICIYIYTYWDSVEIYIIQEILQPAIGLLEPWEEHLKLSILVAFLGH